jgi:hypothetical protein
MIPENAAGVVSARQLVRLLDLIDTLAWPAPTPQRGRPERYAEPVFLKAAVVLVLRHLPTVHALLALLDEPEMAPVRARLCDAQGHLPSRRTWERRLARMPQRLPSAIASLGRQLVARLRVWEDDGRAVALDSTPLRARGLVWNQQDRAAGKVPETRIDTDAHWAMSGWHGWVFGYKVHVLVTVCPRAQVWLPLAAALTPGNVADSTQAPQLLDDLAPLVLPELFVLADSAYHDPDVRARCARDQRVLVASHRGGPRDPDSGTAVRQVFHALRAQAVESWNAQFKHLFALGAQVPTRGLVATQRLVLGAVLVYQLLVLDRFLAGRSLRAGLQAALQAA